MSQFERDKNRYYTGIKVGTKLVGSTKSDVAIKQNVGSLIEMNERALRGITSSRAASEQKVAQLSLAFKSYLETHGIEAPVKVDRSLVKLDSDRDLAGIVETGQGHQSSVFMLPLDRHVNVSGPHYDFEWNWGNPTTKETHLDDGYFGVRVNSEDTHAAAAGIGLVLSSEKQALVSVRAHVRTFWNWSVATTGFFSHAKLRGGIDSSAWVDGKLCTKVRRDLAYEAAASGFDGSKKGEGSGVAWGDNISLDFMMTPQKAYAVVIGAWVEADSSSGIGDAFAEGTMNGVAQFVVVQRFVAG